MCFNPPKTKGRGSKNFQSSELSHRIWYIYDIKCVRWIDSYGLTGYDLGQDRT